MRAFELLYFLPCVIPQLLFSQPTRIKLQVVDNFTKNPVVSEIIAVVNKTEKALGTTDAKGYYFIECSGDEITLKIAPIDHFRYYGRQVVCATLSPSISPNMIALLSRYNEMAINLSIDSLIQINRFADAAYLYNVQADNFRLTDSASAVAANQRQAWISMGKYLNVKRSMAYDSATNGYKISAELGFAIEKYQRTNKIPTQFGNSGDLILDLKTTEKASKTHLYDIIITAPEKSKDPG